MTITVDPNSVNPSTSPFAGPFSKNRVPGLDPFLDMLAQQNPEWFRVADELRGIASGEDPRFAAFQEGQFNLMRANEQAQLGQTSAFFGRRGAGGGTAELNALNRTSGQFDLQRQGLAGQLGMTQMARQDQARLQALGARAGGLQNLLAQPAMNIGWAAANNPGWGGGGGGGGGTAQEVIDYFTNHPAAIPGVLPFTW